MISRLKSSENSCPPSITVLTEVNVKSSSFAIRKKNNRYAAVTARCWMLKMKSMTKLEYADTSMMNNVKT